MFEELKKTYRPESINRLTAVVFHSLSSDMQQVAVMVKTAHRDLG